MEKIVKLVEFIDFSWQGEGPDTGQKCLILRFKKCNRIEAKKMCKWCDTALKLKLFKEAEYKISDIDESIKKSNCMVMITGGEPSFENNLQQTVDIINNTNAHLYNIETNGYKLLNLIDSIDEKKNIKYIYSPKLFDEEDLDKNIKNVDYIKTNNKVHIKMVIEHIRDDELIDFTKNLTFRFLSYLESVNFNMSRVWLMPQGKSKDELISNSPITFDLAEKYKTNFSSRNHVIYNFI